MVGFDGTGVWFDFWMISGSKIRSQVSTSETCHSFFERTATFVYQPTKRRTTSDSWARRSERS